MTDLIQLGIAIAKRGEEVGILRSKIAAIDGQASVFGPGGQPSSYLIAMQDTLRSEKSRLTGEIRALEDLSDDELRKRYTPKPVEAVRQPAGYDRVMDAILSSNSKAPAGFVPGQEYRGPAAAGPHA